MKCRATLTRLCFFDTVLNPASPQVRSTITANRGGTVLIISSKETRQIVGGRTRLGLLVRRNKPDQVAVIGAVTLRIIWVRVGQSLKGGEERYALDGPDADIDALLASIRAGARFPMGRTAYLKAIGIDNPRPTGPNHT